MSRRRQRRHAKELATWTTNTRGLAYTAARQLALDITRPVPEGRRYHAYESGIVLHTDETAWQSAPARYHVARGHSLAGVPWTDLGTADWIITNQRVVARLYDGQIASLWWAGIAGLRVDLAADTVAIDDIEDLHGILSGPAVAPIAVAAIVYVHGITALLDHPALAPLRSDT